MNKSSITGSNNININGDSNNLNVNNYHPEKIVRKVEVIQHNLDFHISPAQQAKIKELVDEIGDMMNGCGTENFYMKMFAALKKRYQIPKYSLLPIESYDDAIAYLKKQKTILRKSLLKKNAQRFKEITIPLIKIRWKYLGRDDMSLLLLATEKFNRPITDLNKLSANDLDTFYSKVFAIKNKK